MAAETQQAVAGARFDNTANYGYQIGLNKGSVVNNIYHTQADGQLPSTPWVSGNVHWTIPRPVNSLFTGRANTLRRLEDLICVNLADKPPSEPCRIVITGMGGQGKSEMCLRIANDLRDIFWGVFWVDVSTFSQAEAAFVAISKQLHKPASTIQEAHQILANIRSPWLLILDNADDPTYDYQEYLPPGNHGTVLMTSRNGECGQYATVHHEFLEALDDDDGIQLLLKTAQIPPHRRSAEQDQARRVCCLLGSHPLALIQAGSYVAKRHCTLANYPQVYDRHRQRLLQFHSKQARSRYGNIYATFEASVDAIGAAHAEGDDAVHLLSLLSALHWSPLPLSVFEACWRAARKAEQPKSDFGAPHQGLCGWHVEKLPRILQPKESEWDPFQLMSALQLLQSLALVSLQISEDSDTISMHPLVHAWSKDRLDPKQQDQSWIAAACLTAFAHASGFYLTASFELFRPHLLSLCNRDVGSLFRTGPPKMLAEALISCGWSLGEMRLDQKLSLLLLDMFKELHLDPLRPEADWLRLYDLQAASLNNLCSRSDLMTVAAQNLRIQEQVLPAQHPERLRSQRMLIRAYKLAGRYGAAVKLLTKMIETQERHKPPTDPYLLDDRRRLAAMCILIGQGDKAVKIAEEVYAMQDQCPRRSDKGRRANKYVLAAAYLSDGQLQRAIELLEDLNALQTKVLPELNPYRLQTLSLLGSAYREDRQFDKAVAVLQDVARGLEESVTSDHHARIVTLRRLAQAFRDNHQIDQAINTFQEVIQAENESMPEDHADRWWSSRQLASAYLETGQSQQSIDMLERVLALSADNHNQAKSVEPETLSALAEAYTRNGQRPKAMYTLEKALAVEPDILASDKRPWLKLQQELSMLLWDEGQRQSAMYTIAQVVGKGNRAMGPDDPDQQEFIRTLKRFFAEDHESSDTADSTGGRWKGVVSVDITPSYRPSK